jgi:hypothetical protein
VSLAMRWPVDVQGYPMDEFRTAANGRSYRLIIPPTYDPLRGKCWVLAEREGVERPVALTSEEWNAMQREVSHAAA